MGQQACQCAVPALISIATSRITFVGHMRKAGERSAAEHCYHLMKGDKLNPAEPRIPICAGGSKSEGQWRREFAAGGTVNGVRVAGIPIHGPILHAEVGPWMPITRRGEGSNVNANS